MTGSDLQEELSWNDYAIFSVWVVGFFLSIAVVSAYRFVPVDGKILVLPGQLWDCVWAVMNVFMGPISTITLFIVLVHKRAVRRVRARRIGTINLIVSSFLVLLTLVFALTPTFVEMQPGQDLARIYGEMSILAGVIVSLIIAPLNVITYSE